MNQIGKKEHDMKGIVFWNWHELFDNMENELEFNLDQKSDNAVNPDIKAELPGVKINLQNQVDEQISPDTTSESDFMDIDYLNDSAKELEQTADNLEVRSDKKSIHKTSNL